MSEHVKDNKLSASLEDYLEAVLAVIIEKKAVRAKDIADRLNVSRSSVTGALQALAAKGYIHYAPYDVITLTSEGEKVAGKIFDKHKTLTDFFAKMLLIDPVLAEKLVSYVRDSLKDPSEWADRFSKYCKDHKKA